MTLLLALFSSSAWSQEELTVYEGTTVLEHVPAYIFYFDDFTRSQYVIPASDLEDMQDGVITALKFYTTSDEVPYTTASEAVVYLKEVDYTSISAYEATDACTTVYTGTLSIVSAGGGGEMTIEFDTPFTYNGGNLLIGIENTTDADWKRIKFYGQDVSGASIAGSNGNSLDQVSATQRNFIPKTTFTFYSGLQVPQNITASNILSDQVDIDWTDFNREGTTWEIAYCEDMGGFEPGSDGYVITNVTSHPFTLTGLNPLTSYEVSVRALVNGEYSEWNYEYNSFTTASQYAPPTDLAAENVTWNSAEFTWTGSADSYNLRYRPYASAEPITQGFESGMGNWTTIDADGDGYCWELASQQASYINGSLAGEGYGGSTDLVVSGSYSNLYGALTPDNYLVSPKVLLGGKITFWACAQDAGYPADHFGVAVSTTVNDDDAAFTTIWESDMTASKKRKTSAFRPIAKRNGPRKAQGTWYQYEIDLSDYSGYGYVAIRHFDCTDWFVLCVDEITIEVPNTSALQPWVTVEGITGNSYEQTGLEPDTNYEVQVCGYYGSNQSAWTESVIFTTEQQYLKPTNLQVSDVTEEDAVLSWTPGEETQTTWDVAYMAEGDADFTLIEGVTDNPYTLSNLTPETNYTVKVRANYGAGMVSTWTGTKTFTTLAADFVPTDLVAEDITFNSATLSWFGVQDEYNLRYRTAAYQTGLSEDWSGGLGNWTTVNCSSNSMAYAGIGHSDNSAFGFCYDAAPPQYLISPKLREVTGDDPLTIWARNYNASYQESFILGYSTTTNDVDAFTWGDEVLLPADTDWHQYELTLPADVTYIAIQCTSDNQYYLFVDDITITGNEQPAGEWVTLEDVTLYYDLDGVLESGTEYEWQVMGVSPDTDWSESAFFTTLDATNTKVFIADGDWDDDDNWLPVGTPDETFDVVIRANAIIPDGTIATAATIEIDGGSITIKDGGQLKTKTEGVPVTIEREINANQYYLLSNPVNKFMMFDDVENLTDGTYDVYQFLANQDYEWFNFRCHSMAMPSGLGFLYANSTSRTVAFTGTTLASIDAYDYNTIDYNSSSTDFFNGWKLVGNPFPCTAYLYAINSSSVLQAAQFYKLNETGEAFEVYSQCVTMAPGESVFIQVTSPSLYYYVSSDDLGFESTYLGTVDYPTLPVKWMNVDQDAAPNFYLVDDADDNDTWFDYFNGYTGVNVGIDGRTLFTDGRWNTICLPFDLTLEGSPLEGATARTLKGASVVDKVLNLDWDDPVTELQAGVPYIIKWETPLAIDNIENPLFTFNSSPVNVNAAPTYDEVDGVVTFVGTYAPVTFDGENRSVLLMGTDSNLFYPDGLAPSWVNAFRGYFQLNANYTAGDKAITGVKMNFDGEATGIDTMQNEEFIMHNSEIYDLSGRRVSTPAKGMYIKDGKKVLIK